jgi:hypothetical protein
MSVYETRADNALKFRIYQICADLFYDPIAYAQIALQGPKIISVDYGAG